MKHKQIIVVLISTILFDNATAFTGHKKYVTSCYVTQSKVERNTVVHQSSLYYKKENDDKSVVVSFDADRVVQVAFTASKVLHSVFKEASEIDKIARKEIGKLRGKESYELGDLKDDISDLTKNIVHVIKTKDYTLEAKVVDEIINLLRLAQDTMLDSKEKDRVRRDLEEWDRRLMEETILPIKEWQKNELKEFERRSSEMERTDEMVDSKRLHNVERIQRHQQSFREKKIDFEKRNAEIESIASSVASRIRRLEQKGYVWNHVD
jgi:hypothetical protein